MNNNGDYKKDKKSIDIVEGCTTPITNGSDIEFVQNVTSHLDTDL